MHIISSIFFSVYPSQRNRKNKLNENNLKHFPIPLMAHYRTFCSRIIYGMRGGCAREENLAAQL